MDKKELLLKSLECYACLNYVQENHMICNGGGGHRTCVRCFEKQNDQRCGVCLHPECKEITDKTVTNIYSFFDILRDCEFSNCGCDMKLTVNEYTKHVKECIHRLIACPSKKCDHKFETGESHMEHLIEKHGFKEIITKNTKPSVNLKIKPLKLKNIVVDLPNCMYVIIVSDTLCRMSEFITTDELCILNVKLRWTDRTIARNDIYTFTLDGVTYELHKASNYTVQITINVTDIAKMYDMSF